MSKSPRQVSVWTVDDMRESAFEALKEQKEKGDRNLGVGVPPEAMFAICNALESAGIAFVGDVDENEDQLEFGFDENDEEESSDGDGFN